MAISASSITPTNSLEDFRIEFNNLVSDVTAVEVTNTFATSIIFEGATENIHETTLIVTDPTADRTITLPNVTGTITLDGNPLTSDGGTLGTTALEWSDIYLADGGVVYLGADQDVSLTHVADTGVLLNSTRKIQFGDSATFIHQSSDGVLTIDGEATIDLNASTAVLVSNDLKLNSDAAVLGFGVDNDVSLTHVADTGVLLNSTRKIQFNDASQFIHGSSATVLSIGATDEIDLTATAVDLNGTLDVSGTLTQTGIATFAARPVFNASVTIQDGGSIGSTSDLNAVTISSGGVVAVTATTASTNSTSGALTVAGGAGIAADLGVGDDLRMISDAAVISFGADSDVTLTHVADTGLLLNSTMKLQFNDASQFIHGSSATVLDIAATDEIELTATLIDAVGNFTVSGTIIGSDTIQGTTITATTAFVPDASDGAALGTTALEFSDLFLADGAVINFGDDQDITLTHNADTGLTLNGVMVATTVEPTGDTSTGDNAALGYTSVLGAILTGQGSTNDVTLVNDADATVLSIPTGTTNVTIAGVVTSSGFTIGSAAILEAELEILDGANVTTTELNLLDGSAKSTSSITLADADAVIVIDGTTTKQIPASDFLSYTSGDATALAIALG